MAEFVPGFNQLSFDPNSFAGSSQISGTMKSFSNLKFNVLLDGETKTLIMKNYYDIGTRLSYVILSTDDSLDPDNATELTTILEYELQENEFLVSVELHGANPVLQVGNMHQIFVKNLRSWDFYASKNGDTDPREVRVCFNAAKEPVVQSFTFNTYGASVGLSSFVWNGTEYPCNHTELATTPFVLYKPSLALKYKHDNVAYTIDDSTNVKVTGKQKISGIKVFEQQPEVTVEPSKDNHLVTKGYFDKFMASYMGTAKKRDISLSVLSQADQSNHDSYNGVYRVTFSNFKAYISDGRHLDPLYIEKMDDLFSTSLTRKRVVLTLNLQDQPKPQPTSKTKEEMDAYQLQDGEFFATIISGYEFKNIDNYYFRPTSLTKHLWVDLCYFDSYTSYTDEPLVAFKLVIHDSDLTISKCSLDTGTSARLSKYYGVELSDDIAQSILREYKSPTEGNLEFNFGGLTKFVTVDGDQTVNGVKTFTNVPKSLGETVEDTDLVTLAYANKNFARAASNGDVTIQLDGKFNNTWMGLSELKVLLQNGKRLEPKFLEKVTVQGYTDSVLMVFGINDDPDAAVVRPADKTRDEIEQYTLGENEFLAELTYSEGLGKAKGHSYERQSCPWDSFLVNGLNNGEVAPMFKLVIKSLTYELKGIKFTTGDKYNTYQYKCTMYSAFFGLNNGPSKTVETKDIQSEITLKVPSGTLVVEQNNSGYVDLTSAQEITGVKTFTKAPKCLADAVDDNDLVTKAYVDSKSSSVDKLPVQEITVFTKAASNNTILMNYLLLDTVDGTHVDPIYYEKKTAYNNLQEPLRVIFSVNAKRYVSSSYTNVSPTEMETRDMDSYVLKDGEFMGSISLPNLVSGGKVNFVGTSDNLPWFHLKVTTRGATEDTPIFKIKIEGKLPAVAKASFQADTTYPGEDFKLAVTAGGITKESEVKRAVAGAVLNLTCTEVPIYEDYYVNTVANQSIMGTKVFKSAPQYLNLAPVARNNGDNLVNFANLASSIGVAVPEKQCVVLTADAKQTKHNNGSTNYMYSWSITVWFQNLVPAFIDPLTGKITPLYIKHYCTDGRAILTTTKPSVEFDKGSVTSKSTSEMDSYTLRKGEYLCKAYWYFLNQRANIDVNGSYIKKNDICGAKVLDLFTNTSSAWREYTTPQNKDASSNIAPSSQVIVEFYNTPEIRYVRAYGNGVGSLWIDHYPFGLAERDSAAQIKSTSAAYNSSEFQEFGAYYRDYFALNAPTSPVEMLPVAPIVANMQATIEKLEARIKTLEDAAKP